VSANDVDRLISHLESKIDLAEASEGPDFYWASLPLCIIDSVFSIQARYAGVRRLVNRWCEAQNPPWKGETSSKLTSDTGPTVRDFIEIIDRRLEGSFKYEDLFCNKQRTSSRGGILKAKAVHLFAKALLDSGINTFRDVRDRRKLEAAEMQRIFSSAGAAGKLKSRPYCCQRPLS
jgi:hypothetical protein